MNHEQQYIETNGITLHVVQAGPEDGELVILLHGAPEFWYGWRAQLDTLAARGYRVWAVDQRGFNFSEKPEGIAAYNLDVLAADIIGLINAAGQDKVYLAGHDWGGAVAWLLAAKYPERLHKLVVVNAPHGSVMARQLRSDWRQMRKSWYMFFCQIPWLPEYVLAQNDFAVMAKALRRSARPETFSDEDLARYRESWLQPDAVRGILNWYRAGFQAQPKSLSDSGIHVPTLLIWGAQDNFLGIEMAEESLEYCDEAQIELIEDGTHWVLHEEPERTGRLIYEFFENESA